jgi:hypothetical protein
LIAQMKDTLAEQGWELIYEKEIEHSQNDGNHRQTFEKEAHKIFIEYSVWEEGATCKLIPAGTKMISINVYRVDCK